MKSHFRRLSIESLEERSLMATTVFADFNSDGLMDVAAITAPNTITVSLAKPDGSLEVSAILSSPKNMPLQNIGVFDRDSDGDLDITASTTKPSAAYFHSWSSEGDGTFDSLTTERWMPKKFVWF